jgi:hypothetical protein
MNLYLFLKCVLPTSDLLAHCGLTCVVSVIFRVKICAIAEVASGIVNASNKDKNCVFGRNVYGTDERNWILEIRLALYCPMFEEMKSSFLNIPNLLRLRVVTLLTSM